MLFDRKITVDQAGQPITERIIAQFMGQQRWCQILITYRAQEPIYSQTTN